jgi:NADH-quinone oxidoreductase subunit J
VAETLFYLLGALSVLCAVGVVRARQPMFSVLALLGAFFSLAGIYLLAGFPFLAATQLLVYAGAIMVLFLFVIMLLNLGDAAEIERQAGASLAGWRLLVAGTSAALLGLVGLGAALSASMPEEAGGFPPGPLDELDALARLLFGRYMLPFEAASLLLLATMVGVIVLAKRQRGARAGRAARTPPRGAPEPAPAAELESGALR